MNPICRARHGAQRVDDRRVISGIIHMLKRARWRDCPPDYNPYTTIYNRFNRWSKQGVWEDVFYALTDQRGRPVAFALPPATSRTWSGRPPCRRASRPPPS